MLSFAFLPIATAADPSRGRVEYERVALPDDQPAAWPKDINRLVSVPRQEFNALIEQLEARNRGPRSAWLKSAHYEATLVGDTLNGGLMTASVKRLPGRSTLLELGPVSFAFDDLKWQDRAATWGSSADGRTWLLADGRNDELLGEWSCRGRSFPGGIDFDLLLPPATISFLDLRVPKGFLVVAPAAEVTQLSDAASEETRLWRIHCGSDSRCRVSFIARAGIEESRRALMVEHDMQVIVREEDLRFQLNLYLESLDASIQDLTLKIPAGLVIYSAVFGVDTPVPIHRTAEAEAEGRLHIRLPAPMSGRRRSLRSDRLRLDGIAVQKPGQPTILPQVVVENSTFDGGYLAVTVQSPLQVRSIRSQGFRQRKSDGESLTFQQLTSDSQLILDVHRAQVSLSGQVLSVLGVEEDSWTLTSEIVWHSQTVGAYQTSCVFPAEWEVTDVSPMGVPDQIRAGVLVDDLPRTGDAAKLNWEVHSKEGGGSILSIEFFESIQPGQARTVKVFARRRSPTAGHIDAVPLPQLLNCDVSEVILGIQIPNSMTPVVSPDSRLERIARPTTTRFSLPPERSNYEQQWYRGDSLDGTGTLQLKPRLQPVHVTTETTIEALPSEYRLKYSILYEHQDAQADRLLIYLTESSPDIRWTWKGTVPLDLSAIRLPKSQHVDWNLPSKGELWELRLPRATGRGVVIEGIANSRWSAVNRPAMLFIPQAVEKLSELKLTHLDTLDVTFDTDGLKPTGQRLSWWYATPQVEFDLALKNPEPSREFPLMVSMQLRTLMSADTDGFDLYRARLQLENGSAQESLRVKLDPSAVILEAFVGGESIAATLQAGEFVVPGLSAARQDTVEIIYRVPAHSKFLYERRRIVIPQVSAQVLGFFWEFGIPPSARLFAEPSGVRLSRSLPAPTWNERLLGPLGRTADEAIFNPFRFDAWMQLLQPRQIAMPSMGDAEGELVAPVEWHVHQAIVPEAPTDLDVELWHAARLQLLTLIILGCCLTIGIVLRIVGWTHRDLLAAYWIGFCLAATYSAVAPFAGIFGSAIAGTLIALLIPRPLLQKVDPPLDVTIDRRRSSPGILITGLLGGLTVFGLSHLFEAHCTAQDPATDDAIQNKRPKVFVFVDKQGQSSETLPLVYVPREALARWKALVSDQATEPNYLISSATYDLSPTSDGNLSLLARYRVHVLRPTDAPVSVALPLSDVSLPDAESCRVNSRAHSISGMVNGKGYSIDLSRLTDSATETASKAIERGRSEDEIATYEIELRSRKPRPPASGMELHVPSVASSRLSISFHEATRFAEIVGARGISERPSDHRSIACELGSTSSFIARWGETAPPRKTAQLSASLLQHLELRPGYSELRFHLNATIDDGSVDTLEFNLPPNAIVRRNQLRADDLLRSDVIVAQDGQRRLRLVFDKSRQSPIIVDGTLVLLQSESLAQTSLPKFGLAKSEWLQFQYERNWWGVSAAADFRLEIANLDPESANLISSDAYLNAWIEAAEPRHPETNIPRLPQATFETREGTAPAFTLTMIQPRRRAIQWKQTGFVGRRRLEWTLVGEIETSQATTFQTVLLVDRRLRIDKITVMENEAERRFRWTESRTDPSRVVLFLSDKTQGKQTIVLKGSLPLIPGTPIALPSIRAEDCEITDYRLVLTRDPEVDLTFTPPREWKEDANSSTPRSDGPVLIGSFQFSDATARGVIQTSSRHSRCVSRCAVSLRRIDETGWQLKYRLELTPEGESPVRIGVIFPVSFVDMNSVTVERAEPAWHEIHDGVRQLDLLLNRSEGSNTVVVQFEIPLAEPKLQDWQLPLPSPLHASSQETVLVVQPEAIWFPSGGVEVRVADLPEWASNFYSDQAGSGVAFKIAKPDVQLQRDVVTTEVHDPLVRLLDQRMWMHRPGHCSGITQVFLSAVRNDLELDLPARVYVTSVFLDEHPLPLPTPANGRLKVPMADAGTESLLTITWVIDGGNAGLRRSETEHLLWPRDIRVERNLITVLPDDPTALWCRSGLIEVTSFDQGLDRLETLLDRHAALGDETRGAIANRWLLDQLQARLAARLPAELKHGGKEVEQRLDRWKRIIEAINQLESVPAAPPITWHAKLLEGPVTDFSEAIRGHGTDDGTIRVWQFDQRLIRLVSSILLALILIPILRRTIRIEWSHWLHRHVFISWLLLAVVWWIFLTPSAFGLALVFVALLRAVVQYRPVRSAT